MIEEYFLIFVNFNLLMAICPLDSIYPILVGNSTILTIMPFHMYKWKKRQELCYVYTYTYITHFNFSCASFVIVVFNPTMIYYAWVRLSPNRCRLSQNKILCNRWINWTVLDSIEWPKKRRIDTWECFKQCLHIKISGLFSL